MFTCILRINLSLSHSKLLLPDFFLCKCVACGIMVSKWSARLLGLSGSGLPARLLKYQLPGLIKIGRVIMPSRLIY